MIRPRFSRETQRQTRQKSHPNLKKISSYPNQFRPEPARNPKALSHRKPSLPVPKFSLSPQRLSGTRHTPKISGSSGWLAKTCGRGMIVDTASRWARNACEPHEPRWSRESRDAIGGGGSAEGRKGGAREKGTRGGPGERTFAVYSRPGSCPPPSEIFIRGQSTLTARRGAAASRG